jgi:hypothetical protein
LTIGDAETAAVIAATRATAEKRIMLKSNS